MVKLLCISGFIVGLLASAISYTIEYFNIDKNQMEQTKQEILEKKNV